MQLPFVKVEWDAVSIRTYSPWDGRRTLLWNELASCRYSWIGNCYVLRSEGRRRLEVPPSLLGIKTFLEAVENELGGQRSWETKGAEMQELGTREFG